MIWEQHVSDVRDVFMCSMMFYPRTWRLIRLKLVMKT